MLSVDTLIKSEDGWQPIGTGWPFESHVKTIDWATYTFVLARGNSPKTWTVTASRPHKWPLYDGKNTHDLRLGDVVAAVDTDSGYNPLGWLHGFLKRQGHSGGWYTLQLNPLYKRFYGRFDELCVDKQKSEDFWQYKFPDVKWQDLPNRWDKEYSPSYVGSFIRGFMDGAKSDSQVQTNDLATAQWIQLYAPYGGYVASGNIVTQLKTNRLKIAANSTFHNEFSFQLVRGDHHGGFRVRDVRSDGVEIKVCPRPFADKLCLIDGIQTYA